MDCSLPGSFVHGDSPGKNTGVGCHALLQGIFPTQGLNPVLLHCRWILYCLSHREAQKFGRGWKSFEVHTRNMDIKCDSNESSERKEKPWTENVRLLREYINNHEQNVGRNTDIKGHSSDVSARMRNRLLESGGTVTLVLMWQNWLNCVLCFVAGRLHKQ